MQEVDFVHRSSGRWYQTDGWEGYKDEEVEEVLTRPREAKPWHVADEQICALVEEVGHREGVPLSLLQHAKCRRPRGEEVDVDDEVDEVVEAPVALRTSLRRSVRFEAGTEDALERMLKRTEDLALEQEPEEERRKKWMISDEDFQNYVLSLAKTMEQEQVSLKSSASAPILRGSDDGESILVHIYFVDSQDVMALRVSPDLRIGPPRAPKGNRFTDIYGLGANTKGFAEFKKFDYQRRQWLSGFQKDWVPAWSVSLKGMISELTGMDVARQRLFCKGNAMNNEQLTLRSWRLRDQDTIQVRFQHKISQAQLEAVRKACELAAGKGHRSAASIHDPSLPVRTEMESSTASDFWKPWMGRKPLEKTQKSRSSTKSERPLMLQEHAASAQLRNSKHLKRCTSKSNVWMMPRWVTQDEPHHFAPTGDPKHHVLQREPERFGERGIYLERERGKR